MEGLEGLLIAMRNHSEIYARKLERYKRQQANKKRLARNLKNKWRLRRWRADRKADQQALEWLQQMQIR